MEPNFNTSFIPKKSLQTGVGGFDRDNITQRRGIYGPGFFITGIIFVLAVLGSFGVFGYTKITERSIDTKINKIERARTELSPQVIEGYERLNLKLQEAKRLVESHTALSEFLFTLEDITLKNVQYTEMSYGSNKKSKGKSARATTQTSALGAPVSISGLATSLATVALQLDQYQTHDFLHDATIDVLERNEKKDETNKTDKTEEMKFSATFFADPQLTSFSRSLSRVPAVSSASETTPPVTGSSTTNVVGEGGDVTDVTP